MQYMILIYGDEKRWEKMSQGDGRKMMADYMQYTKELGATGMMRAGSQLRPVATATTLREKSGKLVTTDGPFAETKEQLAGYYLIDAPDLDSALKWAGKCPGVRDGSVEVRPLPDMPAPQ